MREKVYLILYEPKAVDSLPKAILDSLMRYSVCSYFEVKAILRGNPGRMAEQDRQDILNIGGLL